MATVTVQLGQCGNQLGRQFFDNVHTEGRRASPGLAAAIRRQYFTEDSDATWRARSVLVDTEPRVVSRCLGGGEGWRYNDDSGFYRQGGAANNWAFGFYHHGPAVADGVLDLVRREAERCPRLDGFLAFHSVAGGTGSGLGSYAMQLLEDAFPTKTRASISVWPFQSGEVIVQSYNTVLSMTAAYASADMVLLCENERFLDLCRVTLREQHPSLNSVNQAICESLVRTLLPRSSGTASPLSELSSFLCAHPSYRLVTPRALPQMSTAAQAFSNESWAGLNRRMAQMCQLGSIVDWAPSSDARGGDRGSSDVRPAVSVASAAFLWGAGASQAGGWEAFQRLPCWNLSLEPLRLFAETHQMGGIERSIGMLSNCQTPLPALTAVGRKASAMLRARAYLHQYESYGHGLQEMSEDLLAFLQVQDSYQTLTGA